MELFKVEGWDLKTDKILFKNSKRKELRKRKEKPPKKEKQKLNSDDTIENNDEKVQEPAVEVSQPITQKINKISKPTVQKPAVQQNMKKLTPLQQKMMAKLSGSRFRWINEQLYTISSNDALQLISDQPELFDEYHEGFRSQVQSWPENPVDVFVDQIKLRSKKIINAPGGLPGLYPNKQIVIADMGCGEATLALEVNQFFNKLNKKAKGRKKVNHVVHSFDLKKINDRITVADVRHVPLKDESATIVVFCLSLMGTNFLDFIKEAYRILAPRGELWISEIKSRFSDEKGDEFVNALKLLGFFHKKTDDSNKMFTRFEFFKPPEDIIQERKAKLERRNKFIEVETEKEQLEDKRTKVAEGKWLLKPCIYKRR